MSGGMFDRGFERAAENLPEERMPETAWVKVSPNFNSTKEAYEWIDAAQRRLEVAE